MSEVKVDGRRAAVRPWHVFAFGSVLAVGALVERVQGFRAGRQYVLCHASATLDHLTLLALGLVAGALLVGIVGAAAETVRGKASRPAFLVACMVAALAFVVAADRVDAGAEERAVRMAGEPFTEGACDYAPQVYSATPGWFSW
ncbi:hypothetical protein [Streptomyces sp. NBC_01268]|uniref:hypothetical protein n=1 Tax=unclassified Streptomyces TaxID=2593676 RepID=UPI002E2FC3F4|nr:hypothetical protein [Streptomyces sp. NBC_01268]